MSKKNTTVTAGNEDQGAKYGVGFGEAMARFFQKYATFKGAASLSEYWWAFLGTSIISGVFSAIGHNVHWFGWITFIWTVAIIIPKLAVGVRRLHDAGMNGWFVLLPTGLELLGLITFGVLLWALGGKDAKAFWLWTLIIITLVLWILGLILSFALFAKKTKKGHVDDTKGLEELKKNPEAVLKETFDETVKDTEAAVKQVEAEAKDTASKAAKAGEDAVNAAKNSVKKK